APRPGRLPVPRAAAVERGRHGRARRPPRRLRRPAARGSDARRRGRPADLPRRGRTAGAGLRGSGAGGAGGAGGSAEGGALIQLRLSPLRGQVCVSFSRQREKKDGAGSASSPTGGRRIAKLTAKGG